MNTHPTVQADERTIAVAYAANTWGLNFLLYALLIDIIYRSAVLDQACWDLFALIIVSGAINMFYMAKHKALVQVFSRKLWVVMAVVAVVSFVAAFVVALMAAS